MEDLFSIEQKIHDNAVFYIQQLKAGAQFEISIFEEFVKEYGRLLKQLRRITKMSDRTTGSLATTKIDLLDKIHFDALTGIYNRRFMEDTLKQIIKTISRSGDYLSVMMIDVDFFKKYNDTYGHSGGDACLISVAQAISKSLTRSGDFAARYGGEEFVIILPNTDESGARLIANKVLEAVRDLNIPHEKNESTGYVTISIGVTSSKADHMQNFEDYIKRADAALYHSKNSGRNCFTFLDFDIE